MKRHIGIIGVPGSGKSDLANAVAKKLEPGVILDDYIDDIAEECDLGMSFAADYLGNLFAMTGRIARERNLIARSVEEDTLITVGTLIESAVYTSMDAKRVEEPSDYTRIANFMHIAGVLYQDTFKYDSVFVLPLTEELPDNDHPYARMEKGIRQALAAFGTKFTLLEGSLDERVAKVQEVLSAKP